jgi:hypothetical protein
MNPAHEALSVIRDIYRENKEELCEDINEHYHSSPHSDC